MWLHGPGERDVEIATIHAHLYPEDTETRNNADMQRRLGTYVTRFNRRMEARGLSWKIVPGEVKRTYRLTLTQSHV
jgi:hypothetical protein